MTLHGFEPGELVQPRRQRAQITTNERAHGRAALCGAYTRRPVNIVWNRDGDVLHVFHFITVPQPFYPKSPGLSFTIFRISSAAHFSDAWGWSATTFCARLLQMFWAV